MPADERLLAQLYEKFSHKLDPITGYLKRISKYSAPPEDALIAYPSTTVSIATPTKPDSPDEIAVAASSITGYDAILIFYDGQRISQKVWVICDGPDSLFVISSYDKIKWSGEDEIKPGESRAFTSVRELRVRSPTATTTYRITEYEPDPCCTNIVQGAVTMIPIQNLTATPRSITTSASPALNPMNTSKFSAVSVMIHMGRVTATPFTAGANFRIEASALTSGDGQWYPVTVFTSALGTGATSTTVSTQSNAGQNVLTLTTSVGFAAGDIIFILNATTGNSEFARVTSSTASTPGTVTLEDNLVNTQQVGATVTNKAEMYYALINTSTIPRLRVVVDGTGTGQNFVAEVRAVTG